MYTGRSIDLSQLFDNSVYDIDHIYPRHYVKDDNLDNNLVLVERQKNAHKKDFYPLEDSIYKKCLPMWRELHRQGFINDEKFKTAIAHKYNNNKQYKQKIKASFGVILNFIFFLPITN